MKNVNKFRLS